MMIMHTTHRDYYIFIIEKFRSITCTIPGTFHFFQFERLLNLQGTVLKAFGQRILLLR